MGILINNIGLDPCKNNYTQLLTLTHFCASKMVSIRKYPNLQP